MAAEAAAAAAPLREPFTKAATTKYGWQTGAIRFPRYQNAVH
jgi:hypothetical protein